MRRSTGSRCDVFRRCKGGGHTGNPFEILGLRSSADAEEIRAAYRSLVKKCHPDQFLDAEEQRAAQEKLLALNLAYEEALRLAAPRHVNAYAQSLPPEDAKNLARKMLNQQNPQSALRQLLRAERRDDEWFYLQGVILMALEQYESAHDSFREAVRRDPENNRYRQGALDAALAMKESKTLQGKLKKWLHIKK